MTYLTRYRLSVTCTASDATYQTDPILGGQLYAIRYSKASASAFATGSTCIISAVAVTSGVDADITQNFLTFTGTSVSQMLYPRADAQTTAGASNTTLGGVMLPLVDDRLKVVVASGGANGRGTFDFYVMGR